jgi:NitT/TauT family transport system substrate-binding protein
LHKEFGIPDTERAAIELLPKRLIDIYSVDWGKPVFANIERQIDEAVKVGILAKRPDKPVYDASIAVTG